MNEMRTYNYDWFKKMVSIGYSSRVGRLSDPIIVNEHYFVIEGWARFIERRRRGLPIKYIVVPGLGRFDARVYAAAM